MHFPVSSQLSKPLSTLSIPGQQPQQQPSPPSHLHHQHNNSSGGSPGATAAAAAPPSSSTAAGVGGDSSAATTPAATAAAAAAAASSTTGGDPSNANAMPLKGPGGPPEGDASIALVGVRSEFPKYPDEKVGMHHNKDPRGSSVGYR